MTYSVAGRKISLELAKFERKTVTRQEETDMAGELILCVYIACNPHYQCERSYHCNIF